MWLCFSFCVQVTFFLLPSLAMTLLPSLPDADAVAISRLNK
jgi:hypothetical protein